MRRNHARYAFVAAALAVVLPAAASGQTRQTTPPGREAQIAPFSGRLACEWLYNGAWGGGSYTLHARNTLRRTLPVGTRLAYSYRLQSNAQPNALGAPYSGETVLTRVLAPDAAVETGGGVSGNAVVAECSIVASYGAPARRRADARQSGAGAGPAARFCGAAAAAASARTRSGRCTRLTSTKLNSISRYHEPILSIGTTCQPARWLG